LTTNGIDFENLTFIQAPFNTVWVRDYGPNPVYQNDVDSLVLIDWIYNRPRPADDVIPNVISEHLGAPLYTTTEVPYDLVHTGGNFMADGLGMGFSSQLILEENDISNNFGTSNHTEGAIDTLMELFMGIEEYPKMQSLLYDGINHIDMHMKLLDEQTLLIGEFPEGTSDGPQIEENIQYVLDFFKTYWDTDFRVERIIQPPCRNGQYPPYCSASYEYRTYTNALFVNKTVLVPIYLTDTDSLALARWQELMPGYKIRGIDCRQIINSGGAIHCVTKEIGVNDPLWIAHRGLDDVEAIDNIIDYTVEAKIKHRSGIESAELFWTADTLIGYQNTPMFLVDADQDIWAADIPQQADGSQIFYYIQAHSNSGKSVLRPLPAPEGYFSFRTGELASGISELEGLGISIEKLYPNPAKDLAILEINSTNSEEIELVITDVLCREVATIFKGKTKTGLNQYTIKTDQYVSGSYFIQLKSRGQMLTKKLVIH
jgi:agmatine/peptidylarginine deiminase